MSFVSTFLGFKKNVNLIFTGFFLVAVAAVFSITTSCQQLVGLEDSNSGSVYARLDYINTEPSNKDIKRIVIVGTNDFHGNLEVQTEKLSIGGSSSGSSSSSSSSSTEKISYEVGGAPIIAAYFKIIREHYGNELLLLDAGDIYSGTLISDIFKGESIMKFYDYLGYDAVTFGNHEFDYGPENLSRRVPEKDEDPQGALKKLVGKSKIPFLTSNILELSTGKLLNWPGVLPYLVKEVNGVRVGVIALTTTETPDKTIRENVRGLYFENLATAVVKMSREVRYKGADIVVLLTHTGNSCETPLDKPKINLFDRDAKYKKDFSLCDPQDEIYKLLKMIPQNTVDAVVSGHTHTNIAHYFDEIPVIQSFNNGKYFGQMELFYDVKEKKLLRNKTIIYSPTKFCHKFFASSHDCSKPKELKNAKDTAKDTKGSEKFIPAKFLGKIIEGDSNLLTILKPFKDEVVKIGNVVILTLETAMPHDRRAQESILGTLAADALRFVGKTNVAITNSGGIRVGLPEGKVTF
ncbi:MAG: metallophosphoesterase, partial [Oligoflexia bacterium]|nr:metallophosphoesterase [Oligoflexia bacterium]